MMVSRCVCVLCACNDLNELYNNGKKQPAKEEEKWRTKFQIYRVMSAVVFVVGIFMPCRALSSSLLVRASVRMYICVTISRCPIL